MFDGITVRKWFDILTDEEPTRPIERQVAYTIRPSRTGVATRWLAQVISKRVLFEVHSVSE